MGLKFRVNVVFKKVYDTCVFFFFLLAIVDNDEMKEEKYYEINESIVF